MNSLKKKAILDGVGGGVRRADHAAVLRRFCRLDCRIFPSELGCGVVLVAFVCRRCSLVTSVGDWRIEWIVSGVSAQRIGRRTMKTTRQNSRRAR